MFVVRWPVGESIHHIISYFPEVINLKMDNRPLLVLRGTASFMAIKRRLTGRPEVSYCMVASMSILCRDLLPSTPFPNGACTFTGRFQRAQIPCNVLTFSLAVRTFRPAYWRRSTGRFVCAKVWAAWRLIINIDIYLYSTIISFVPNAVLYFCSIVVFVLHLTNVVIGAMNGLRSTNSATVCWQRQWYRIT